MHDVSLRQLLGMRRPPQRHLRRGGSPIGRQHASGGQRRRGGVLALAVGHVRLRPGRTERGPAAGGDTAGPEQRSQERRLGNDRVLFYGRRVHIT